jgi:hypothetical protein
MGLSMTAGMSFAAYNDKGGDTGMTPFARIAKIPVVLKEDGSIDREETYKEAKRVATVIGLYVANNNDKVLSGFPADWIVGGLELESGEIATDDQVNGATLRIPAPDLIDPEKPELGIKKANVMDLCNAH